jgi:putative protease
MGKEMRMKKKKAKAAKSARRLRAKVKTKKARKGTVRRHPKRASRSGQASTGVTRKPQIAPEKTPAPTVIAPPNSVHLGRVEDYFAKIGVIALTLESPLRLGDHLHILGHTTNLEQTVDSMQINHQPVTEAAAQAAVGIKVTARVRRGDHVYLIR